MLKRIFYIMGWVIYFPIFAVLTLLMFTAAAFYGLYDFITKGTSENAIEWFDKTSEKLICLY